MTRLLTVDGLVVAYDSITALHGVDLTVDTGEVVAVLGANGAGKTTLLRVLSGMIRPRHGQIHFDGQRLDRLRPAQIVRCGVAHAPEGRQIFGQLSVLDNLRLGAYARNKGRLTQSEVERIFELFPRLAERRSQLGGTLSGGEQQMLAIARALLARPRLLLLDEPSMGLAPTVVTAIFEALAKIVAETDLAMLLVEQLAHAALDLAGRGYVLESGRVVESGPSAELSETALRAAYLGSGS